MKDLSDAQIAELVDEIKRNGSNDAWTKLVNHFREYIEKLAGRYNYDGPVDVDDLVSVGMIGFMDAVRNFDPSKGGSLKTYATYFINGAIYDELKVSLNPMGMQDAEGVLDDDGNKILLSYSSIEQMREWGEEIPNVNQTDEPEAEIPDYDQTDEDSDVRDVMYSVPENGKFTETRRAIQILEVLKKATDEEHPVTQKQLAELLKVYRTGKYQDSATVKVDNTFTRSIEEILSEVDPIKYTGENDDDYQIKYSGYQKDHLDSKKNGNEKNLKITDFAYHHTFSNDELDQLINVISMSIMLSDEDRNNLVSKILSTASMYYKNSLWDGQRLRYGTDGVQGRFLISDDDGRKKLAENIYKIRRAICEFKQIHFYFNHYNEKHELVRNNMRHHILSPYHLVVYNDQYFCIGLRSDDRQNRIWHYRLDLMSDIEPYLDPDGKERVIEVVPFEGLPIFNAQWNPEEYLAKHLNMGYDEPKKIRIRINKKSYNRLHDAFSKYYKKLGGSDDPEYDVVIVETSPHMMVRWAMQHADEVEVLNEDIREEILSETEKLAEMYKKK